MTSRDDSFETNGKVYSVLQWSTPDGRLPGGPARRRHPPPEDRPVVHGPIRGFRQRGRHPRMPEGLGCLGYVLTGLAAKLVAGQWQGTGSHSG